jgi:uncharacterized protein
MFALRYFYLGLGWLSVGLGIVGIILPILPTTPFLLVAVWAFSRSSPEMAEKLRNHPQAGPYIRDWQDYGVIPMTGKVLAIIMMSAMGIYLWSWWLRAFTSSRDRANLQQSEFSCSVLPGTVQPKPWLGLRLQAVCRDRRLTSIHCSD